MSDWADRHVAALREGKTVQFRPRGGSMRGRIESGQLVTVEPLVCTDPTEGSIVLVQVRGRVYLHLIKATRGRGEAREYLIGNNRGGTNGWVRRRAIYGTCTRIED